MTYSLNEAPILQLPGLANAMRGRAEKGRFHPIDDRAFILIGDVDVRLADIIAGSGELLAALTVDVDLTRFG